MGFRKYFLTIALWPLLLAQTCVKEAEENNTEDPVLIETGQKNEPAKPVAIEDWEIFLKQSQVSIENIEENIGNLEIKIDELDSDQKSQPQEVCDSCNLALIKLKAKRAKRNKEFEKELKTYDSTAYEKNAVFMAAFDHAITDISNKLGNLQEKIRSGYYK